MKRLRSSLTLKIFILTLFLLLAISGITYASVAVFLPKTYRNSLEKDLASVSESLKTELESYASIEEAENFLEFFERNNQASVTVLDKEGNQVFPEVETEVADTVSTGSEESMVVEEDGLVTFSGIAVSDEAAEELGAAEIATVSRTGELNYENLAKRFGKRDFYLINTTPVGMMPQSGVSPLDLQQFPRCKGVADVIYNPLRTRLCQQAAELGIPACGGLLMLAAQAAAAEYAFGTAAPGEETVLRVYRELLAERRNLVFIGMPGSGKTTIGRLAAQMLEREFIDCDEEYLLEYGITPEGELLAHGELYFREREEALLRKLSPKTGCVIAAGGGAILREKNVEGLRENGLLCWLRRPLELLPTEGRPLSTDLPGLYRQREPLYRAAADFSVENTGLPKAAAEAAARGLDLR